MPVSLDPLSMIDYNKSSQYSRICNDCKAGMIKAKEVNMSSKTFNETAMEFVKIYYSCHPGQLPQDKDKAFSDMQKLHGKFKEKLIEGGIRKNEDFFSDRFDS